jgi:hypothetical protein
MAPIWRIAANMPADLDRRSVRDRHERRRGQAGRSGGGGGASRGARRRANR